MDKHLNIRNIYKLHEYSNPYGRIGKILANQGNFYEVGLSNAVIGSNVEFVTEFGEKCLGEVISIKKGSCIVMPYEEISGINNETRVFLKDLSTTIKISPKVLGRILDFQCCPIDDKGPIESIDEMRSIFGNKINPLKRPPITHLLSTGVHAIDCFATVGKGQRLAIMAGSGVGKSVTMGMIAQRTSADVNVIALVGERGREVLEFIQNDLGEEGLKKSVVVVATSDQSPLVKIKAAYTASTIAEYFRDKELDVVLMVDSITRFAMACREISLGAGEPPGPKGYTPGVFSKLPLIMERAGTKKGAGTITGFYTVLVEGGDIDEPISDAVKAISDGHVILSRELAMKNQFPAIEILQSLSRVMNNIVSREHRIVASHLRDLLAVYKENEDLINVGAYSKGSNPKVDKAILIYDDIVNLVKQELGSKEFYSMSELYDKMIELARKAEGLNAES